MTAKSNWFKNQIRTHVFRTGDMPSITQLHFALYTSATDDDSGGTEVAGNNYSRAQLDPSDANWNESGGDGIAQNTAVIQFAAPTGGDWGLVTHFRAFDQSGNAIYHGALTNQKNISDGDDAPSWPANQFVVDEQ